MNADLIGDSYMAKILERLDPGVVERRRQVIGVLPTSDDVAREIVRRCCDRSEFGQVSFVWTPEDVITERRTARHQS